ncbi:hypothetical protein EVAR_25330_1 [Eumeta japonica]|uniref:Uncharacterized protein n=1 Tax=Eumeta variegata TaxID=151549 RepID=A0A4C1VMY2_EUMVA|nr:hypothetical protein EVAR_25330_1 [Eumeta japonica]
MTKSLSDELLCILQEIIKPRTVARLSTVSRYVLEALASRICPRCNRGGSHTYAVGHYRSAMSSSSLITRCRVTPDLSASLQKYVQAPTESHGSQTSRQRMAYHEDPRKSSYQQNRSSFVVCGRCLSSTRTHRPMEWKRDRLFRALARTLGSGGTQQ